MTTKNTKTTAETTAVQTVKTLTPIIDRWDTLPTNPIDGQIGFLESTKNFKTWFEGIGWGTTAVTFLPSDNIKQS